MEIVKDVTIAPRLMSVQNAAAYSGRSRATLYKDQKLGLLEFVKMDGSTLVTFEEINRYIDAKMKAAV